MADETLKRLEQLRTDAVERARLALGEAQRQHAEARLAEHAARTAELERATALGHARSSFARANTVFGLRTSALHMHALEAELKRAVERVARTALLRQRAELCVRARADALRTAELARRAVRRNLEQRALDVSLRTERREEDERDDQFRAASSARAP
ncbi:MAG: hypothetical protein JWN48_6105 [Myxococcaceae bacterium]|nr:hypothetical protein [Myxococcaceae bacterium]